MPSFMLHDRSEVADERFEVGVGQQLEVPI